MELVLSWYGQYCMKIKSCVPDRFHVFCDVTYNNPYSVIQYYGLTNELKYYYYNLISHIPQVLYQ